MAEVEQPPPPLVAVLGDLLGWLRRTSLVVPRSGPGLVYHQAGQFRMHYGGTRLIPSEVD
jgi:hypothetical protein